MASRLNPYLSFPGTAREAMEFYQGVFGGTLTMNTFGEFGAADTPEADKIMHSALDTDDGFHLMGADTPPGMEHHPGDAISVCLSGDDTEQMHGYWDKLSEGGSTPTPLEKQMWGDEYGMCVDRFGVPWMINIAAVQE